MAHVDAHRHDVADGREVGVEPICAVLKKAGNPIAPSSAYAAKTWPPSTRAIRDAELIEDIKVAHKAANIGVYGARKIHAELNREGIPVARCTAERLMKAEDLRGIPRERTRKTTIGGPVKSSAEKLATYMTWSAKSADARSLSFSTNCGRFAI